MGWSDDVPLPIFIESNLGTRLAAPLSPNITTNHFKRELEEMHLNCFPEFGRIKVNALMVKQQSHYYHLSESLLLKHAFLGSNDNLFLRMDVTVRTTPDHVESLKCNVVTDSFKAGCSTISTLEKRSKCISKKVNMQRFPYFKAPLLKFIFLLKRKRRNVKRKRETRCPSKGKVQSSLVEEERLCQLTTRDGVCQTKKRDSNVVAESHSDTFSEPASVSRIIKKYFSDCDEEVGSSFTRVRREWLNSGTNARSPSSHPLSEASREKHVKPEVGRRFLLASESLGLSPSNQRSILTLCRHHYGESPVQKSTATVGGLVFEMTEESE